MTQRTEVRFVVLYVVLVLTLAMVAASVGCAHLGSLDQTVYDLTDQVVTATEHLHAQHVLSDAQFKQASLAEHDIAVAGAQFNALLKAGTAKPTDGKALLGAVRAAIGALQRISSGAFRQVLDLLAQLDLAVANFVGA